MLFEKTLNRKKAVTLCVVSILLILILQGTNVASRAYINKLTLAMTDAANRDTQPQIQERLNQTLEFNAIVARATSNKIPAIFVVVATLTAIGYCDKKVGFVLFLLGYGAAIILSLLVWLFSQERSFMNYIFDLLIGSRDAAVFLVFGYLYLTLCAWRDKRLVSAQK